MAHAPDPPADPAIAKGAKHEPAQDVSLRAIGLGALLVTALSLVGLLGAAWVDSEPSPRERAAVAIDRDDLVSPRLRPDRAPLAGPVVEADSTATLRTTRLEESAHLSTYRWIDRAAGVIALPIERAMELVAREGLPVFAPPAIAPKDGR